MGRLTPDPAELQGPPKRQPPKRQPDGYGPFRCAYCGRYGQPGLCEGCGAPTLPSAGQPLPPRRPDSILSFPKNRVVTCCVPEFPMVKR
jgi:hypothetical protein